MGALKHQESGDSENANKALIIVRSHLEELEREAALRKKSGVPPPGTTPAEVASELLRRWQEAQCEERQSVTSGCDNAGGSPVQKSSQGVESKEATGR
jgi:hypothetical protein